MIPGHVNTRIDSDLSALEPECHQGIQILQSPDEISEYSAENTLFSQV